jgi:GNAT superfamily N-acetyltransferase
MLAEIDPRNPSQNQTIAEIWTQACGNCFSASPAFIAYNLDAPQDLRQQARFALDDRSVPVGFVVASLLIDDPLASPSRHGWIDAVAVLPEAQEQGLGTELMQWAEAWLVDQGCTEASLGGGIRTFAPGLPPDTLSEAFFDHRGFQPHNSGSPKLIWDVASDLGGYESPQTVREVEGRVRPGTPGDEEALLAFLRREFPGRWRYETEEYLTRTGRIADYMLLWTEEGVEGFCWLTFEDSARPLDRYYPYALPRPWGQLGPIGVSKHVRGRGCGAAVLDAGLRRLRDTGVRGCVIDWTSIIDFYAKFGFSRYREYLPLVKKLA